MTTTNVERRFSLGMSSEFHQRPKTPTKWNWNSFSRRVLPSHVHRKFHKTPRWQQKFKDQRYPPKKTNPQKNLRDQTPRKTSNSFPPSPTYTTSSSFFLLKKKAPAEFTRSLVYGTARKLQLRIADDDMADDERGSERRTSENKSPSCTKFLRHSSTRSTKRRSSHGCFLLITLSN